MQMFKKVLKPAFPVMVSYLVLSLVCGIVSFQVGFTPLQILLTSAVLYSGSGQFLLAGLYGAGASLVSIIITLAFLGLRFVLMSMSSSRHVRQKTTWFDFFFSMTISDESFGVNTVMFSQPDWTADHALALNLLNYGIWVLGSGLGALLVSVVDLDTSIISYGLTAMFICMTVEQFVDRYYLYAGLISVVFTIIALVILQNSLGIVVGALLASLIGFQLKWTKEGQGHE